MRKMRLAGLTVCQYKNLKIYLNIVLLVIFTQKQYNNYLLFFNTAAVFVRRSRTNTLLYPSHVLSCYR